MAMSNILKIIEKKRAILSFILGIVCAIGIEMSITREITPTNSDIEPMSAVGEFFRTLYLSLSSDRIVLLVLAIFIAILIYMGSKICMKTSWKIVFCVFSFVFSLSQLLAISYDAINSWDYVFSSGINIFRSFVKGISLMIVFYEGSKLLLELCKRYGIQKELVSSKVTWKNSLLTGLLIFVAWIPYFIIFYPGTANVDTVVQMMQTFSIESYINDLTTIHPPETYYTNHHPYLTTVLFGAFFKLGLNVFGDIRIGVAIYVVCHMMISATAFTVSLQYLRHIGVTKNRRLVVLLVVMFLPIFPMYAICMLKDTLYAIFSLLLVVMMYEVARTKGEVFKKIWFDILFALNSIALMLTKNYGLYVILIIGIIYLIVYRKKFLQILGTIAIPVLLYRVLWIMVLLPLMNVAPVGKQEALSVPFQQTARYVSEYGDEVTAEEKEAISKILPYDNLAKYYRPDLSDYIKEDFYQDSTSSDLLGYFEIWFKMFFKHPTTYIEATLNNTYEYWDIDKISNMVYYEFEPYLQKQDKENQYEELYVVNSDSTKEARYVVNQIMLSIEKIPVVNVFMSIGILPWIIIFMLLFSIYQKKKDYILIMLVPLITYLICMVSPDNGNSRYIMPVIYSLLFIVMMLFIPTSENDKIL